MATFGLQTEFTNKILREYFGLSSPVLTGNEIYVGLGLTQEGALSNTSDFTEVFGGKPYGNYRRARAIFGHAVDELICNLNEIVFDTASEDWTSDNSKVEMIGLFTTNQYEDEFGNKVKPIVVLRLPQFESVLRGETIILAPNAIQLSLSDI
jgi:hypothetical protein